jgi:hypothetical protein
LLRTYYGKINGQDHDEAFRTMTENAILEIILDKNGSWNDKALYDFGDDWQRVLLRVPELCDILDSEGFGDEDDEDDDGLEYEGTDTPPTSDPDALKGWLGYQNDKIVTHLYVADREAMKSGKIKGFYLDVHGNAIWHHKFRVENMIEYSGVLISFQFLDEINSRSMTRENGSEIFL